MCRVKTKILTCKFPKKLNIKVLLIYIIKIKKIDILK